MYLMYITQIATPLQKPSNPTTKMKNRWLETQAMKNRAEVVKDRIRTLTKRMMMKLNKKELKNKDKTGKRRKAQLLRREKVHLAE